jgi:hypothetical protein
MAGIRIQHPTARSCRYTVVDAKVPYPVPFQCTPPALGGCGAIHLFKTHHINLDQTGAGIVSEGVFTLIRDRLALDGFLVSNEVPKPPAIGVGLASGQPGAWGDIPIVRSPNGIEPV